MSGSGRAKARRHAWRAAAAGLVFVPVLGGLSGCGDEAAPETAPSGAPSAAEFDGRAERLGVAVEIIYVIDLKGYHRATGAMGVYGNDGFQDIYVSDKGDDVRLTVERRTLTAANCPALPIPAAQTPGGSVQCTPDGDGWRRTSGDRQEYAVVDGGHLVRVSGRVGATTFDLLRDAAKNAHPADPEQLDKMLPPSEPGGPPGETPSGQVTPPPRGDLPPHGDGAPDNHVGPGG
ncbi:hypothetical protein SAMN04489712_10614 [Thermomonospora echinospora]|uniref:Uncharacterized protein n=1 Tax=Thermomonospora echinospora TaxID=1992 RepID=A0A1H6AVD0_9ACTN|nr:hypothetical protein [Thermomonospora echinospora]SEG52210.1 hypothetical protein SAMN04489712_10614 [Thermomonospora echinospora]